MKHGAYHYITKNFDYDELRSLVRNACERQDLNRQVITLQRAGGGTERARVPDWSEPPDPRHRRSGAEGREAVGDGADSRRERDRQGTAGATAPPGIGAQRRAVHRGQPSAIPHELVESTLFGHERGAFTGAHKQQLGKFELATGGTLFLDEIGDLRFDLQAKLLRAIQEGEIERVGGRKPIKTNFRLVVATNVDLREGGQGRAVPRGPVLPDQRHPDPHAAAPRSHRGSAGARAPVSRSLQDEVPEAGARHLRFGAEDPRLVLVAGQHPRAREPDRAAGRGQRQGVDHGRGSAARVSLRQARLRADHRRGAFQEACDTFERNFILRALEKSDWNVTATARYLGIPLSTLKHKMSRLDLREIARKLRGA